MFVSSRMEDYLRMKTTEYTFHTINHTDIPHYGRKLYLREFLFQLQTYIVHRRLCTVKQNQLLQTKMTKLTAKLTADRPGSSGNHNDFSFEKVSNLSRINMDFITPQQIFDTYVRKIT